MVQGLGQRRGTCSEVSPGIPFMWRKVEMRLACTATRLPPTPTETKRPQTRGERRVPKRRVRHREERRRQPLPPFQESSNPPIPTPLEMWQTHAALCGCCAGGDTGGSVDSGSLTSPAAGGVHTAQGTRPCLPWALSKAPSRPGDPMVLGSGLSSVLWNLKPISLASHPNLVPAPLGLALSPTRLTLQTVSPNLL